MSEISIPIALGPTGNLVPIEEAIRFKSDYYRCPECKGYLSPRKGPVKAHFYAHKKGTLEETNCPLGTQADVEELIDEFRTSDVEESEQQRQIRTYFGETGHGRKQLFGVIPALEWDDIPPTTTADAELADLRISTSGVKRAPVAANFHPAEPEVNFELDPSADSFTVELDGPDTLERITGHWTSDGLSDGDLFLGDQSRARRHRQNRQIKQGEWVYLALTDTPASLPDLVEVDTFGDFTILAFPARDETSKLLDTYGTGLKTDEYGFEADVILPPTVHPTSDAPLSTPPAADLLVGVTPSTETDPVFEVVSIPKSKHDTVEIDPTGPGNPRFYSTKTLDTGSRRVSIHQRNSNRHRMVHTYADPDHARTTHSINPDSIGLLITDDGSDIHLSPVDGRDTYTVSGSFNTQTIPALIEYTGPEGFELEITGHFPSDSPHGTRVHRSTTDLSTLLPEVAGWVSQDCYQLTMHFDALGSITLLFPPVPDDADTIPTENSPTDGAQ